MRELWIACIATVQRMWYGSLLPQERVRERRQADQRVPEGTSGPSYLYSRGHHHHHQSSCAHTHTEAAHRASLTRLTRFLRRPSNSQEHWLHGGHKKACKAYVLAATFHAQQERLCKAAVEADRCLVCLGPPHEPTRLPCGHSFCTGCVGGLRSKGVSETCPLCRAPLPPGPEKLYELAERVWQRIARVHGTRAWPPLSASQQKEMDGAIVMYQEAMDQVGERARARFDIGSGR